MKIRFMSAQRGKKTRSATSRYRRYVRLTSTTGELRLQLIKCQSKKEKERHAKRETRAVGRSVSTHTASPSLPSLTVGLRGAFATFRCGRLQRLQKAPSPPSTFTVFRTPPARNRRLQSLSTTLVKSGASRVRWACLLAENTAKRTPSAAKHLSQVSVLLTENLLPPVARNNSYRQFALGTPRRGTAFNAIVTGILPAPVAATRTGSVISQYGSS